MKHRLDKPMSGEAPVFSQKETITLKALKYNLENQGLPPKYLNREAVLMDCLRHLMNGGDKEIVKELISWLA